MKLRYRILSVISTLVAIAIVSVAVALSRETPCPTTTPPSSDAATMNAITHRCYGPPDVLALERVAKPTPGDTEILAKVHAASINPFEWHRMTGTPYLIRTGSGLGAPEDPRIGVDFAGTVEAVGRNVTRFKPGDEVFGAAWGAFAEYIVFDESQGVVLKPANVGFEQAAAVPIAGTTALQALRDKGALQRGQSVLINGASGGVGTFAVQIAKALGAEVTGVCSTRNLELVRSIGADHVIDYTREDFTIGPARYDLIVDNVGNRDLLDLAKVLKPNGRVVLVGTPKGGKWIGPLWGPLKSKIIQLFIDEEFTTLFAMANQADMELLRKLMSAGKIEPVVDRRYALRDVPEAMRYLQTWRARGKVIVTVE